MLDFQLKQPTRVPFGYGVISHFHHSNYHGTYDDLLALTVPVSLRFLTHLWLGVLNLSCPSINRFDYLLTARAESETLLRRDRAGRCSEIESNQFNRPRVDDEK